jgi:hypothetical protein
VALQALTAGSGRTFLIVRKVSLKKRGCTLGEPVLAIADRA